MSSAMVEHDRPEVLTPPPAECAAAVDAEALAPFALVIDDEDTICRSVAATLAELRIETTTYTAARDAVASLDQRRPDIIFLDMALVNADAIDVMRWLSEKRYTGIVQLMSGGRRPLLEAMQRIGARYGLTVRSPLQKPVSSEAIRQVIADVGLAR